MYRNDWKGVGEMKLGIIGEPKESSFKTAKEKGLEFLEFCINVGSDIDQFINNIDKIIEWKKTYDVGIQ